MISAKHKKHVVIVLIVFIVMFFCSAMQLKAGAEVEIFGGLFGNSKQSRKSNSEQSRDYGYYDEYNSFSGQAKSLGDLIESVTENADSLSELISNLSDLIGNFNQTVDTLTSGARAVTQFFTFIRMLIGAATCLFGYKLFKIMLGFLGACTGFLIGFIGTVAANLSEHSTDEMIGRAIIGGIILAVIMAVLSVKFYYVGIFLAFGGIMTAIVTLLSQSLTAGILAGIIVGVVICIIKKYAIIGSTALSGGWQVGFGMASLAKNDSGFIYTFLAVVIGFIFQVWYNDKRLQNRTKEFAKNINIGKLGNRDLIGCACGAVNNSSAKYCQSCGAEVIHKSLKDEPKTIICDCGQTNDTGSKFCSGCGKALEVEHKTEIVDSGETEVKPKKIISRYISCICGGILSEADTYCPKCGKSRDALQEQKGINRNMTIEIARTILVLFFANIIFSFQVGGLSETSNDSGIVWGIILSLFQAASIIWHCVYVISRDINEVKGIDEKRYSKRTIIINECFNASFIVGGIVMAVYAESLKWLAFLFPMIFWFYCTRKETKMFLKKAVKAVF